MADLLKLESVTALKQGKVMELGLKNYRRLCKISTKSQIRGERIAKFLVRCSDFDCHGLFKTKDCDCLALNMYLFYLYVKTNLTIK